MKLEAFPIRPTDPPFDRIEIITIIEKIPRKISLHAEQIDFVNDVVMALSDAAKCPVRKFLTRARYPDVTRLRHLLAYFLATRMGISFEVIGGFICGLDHSGIRNSLRSHESLLISGTDQIEYLDLLLVLRRKFFDRPIVPRLRGCTDSFIALENRLCGGPIETIRLMHQGLMTRSEIQKHLTLFCAQEGISDKTSAILSYVDKIPI